MIPTSEDVIELIGEDSLDYIEVDRKTVLVDCGEGMFDRDVTIIFKHKDFSQNWRSNVRMSSWEGPMADEPVPVDSYVIPTSMWLTVEEVLKYNI